MFELDIFQNLFKLILLSCVLDVKPANMATKKITLAFVILFTACIFQACNGSHAKTGMDTQSGMPAASKNAGGSDTSHTTDNRRNEVSGVNPQPATAPKSANGSTTAQGQTGADSVYQKGTQKSQK